MFLFLRPWIYEKDFVYIEKDNSKPDDYCNSWLGKRDRQDPGKYTGENEMVFNSNCFDYRSVMHQFFHTLGCPHENQRPDHNKYIKSQ